MKRILTTSLLALAAASLVGATSAAARVRGDDVGTVESRVQAQVDANLREVLPELVRRAHAE